MCRRARTTDEALVLPSSGGALLPATRFRVPPCCRGRPRRADCTQRLARVNGQHREYLALLVWNAPLRVSLLRVLRDQPSAGGAGATSSRRTGGAQPPTACRRRCLWRVPDPVARRAESTLDETPGRHAIRWATTRRTRRPASAKRSCTPRPQRGSRGALRRDRPSRSP